MEVRSVLTGTRGVSLPFTDFCRALGTGHEEMERRAVELARSAGWRYIEFRSDGGSEGQGDAANGASSRVLDKAAVTFWGHEVALGSGDEAALFAGLSPAVRRAVRKAENNGVTTTVSQDAWSMAQYYKLHCATRRRHGLPPQPYRFFESIARWIISPGKGFVVLGKRTGKIVSGAIFMLFGSHAVYKFGASVEEAQPVRANNLVMWRGLLECAARGCHLVHLGRTSNNNTGLRQYKRGFGAVEIIMGYRRFDLRRDAYVQTPDGAEANWVNHVFRAMPPSCLRLAGQILYPHMS